MAINYELCELCPRACRVNRAAGSRGFCGETAELRLASAGLHFGEEPPVTGTRGSGTIFVTGCTLQCSFCQNYQISQDGMGKVVTSDEFADICCRLQDAGAENINIVTGSHAVLAIANGLEQARHNGLSIPILWNSSSYESPDIVDILSGLVTVWLPDLKTLNPLIAQSVFKAPDYPSVAKKVIKKMAAASPLQFDSTNKITSGVIVRHLALPGRMDDTRLVLEWFAKHIKDNALLSLMTQYTPVHAHKNAAGLTAFQDRLINDNEYTQLTHMLEELNIDNGFYQELEQDTSWLPDFTRTNPFSSKLATSLWHWSTGFCT